MTTGTIEGEFIATMDDPDDPEMFERNRIHTNAGAQEYGFQGAFVGGVTLYAWCVPTVIEALGEEWLDHGWVNIRFRRPTYPGARIRVRVRAQGGFAGLRPGGAPRRRPGEHRRRGGARDRALARRPARDAVLGPRSMARLAVTGRS